MKKFERLIQQKCKEQPRLPDTHCAGLLLANWAHTPARICEAAGAALEDANQHVLAWLMFEAGNGKLSESLRQSIQIAFEEWLSKNDLRGRETTCGEVPVGHVFKYADSEGDGLMNQTQFIKLHGGKNKVVNVANWTTAKVDEDQEVIVLGRMQLCK